MAVTWFVWILVRAHVKTNAIILVLAIVKTLALEVVAEDQAAHIHSHLVEVMAAAQVATIVRGDVKTVAVQVAELHAQVIVEIIAAANAKPIVLMIVLQLAKGLAGLNVIQHAQENAKGLVGLLALIFVKTALIAVVAHAETVV